MPSPLPPPPVDALASSITSRIVGRAGGSTSLALRICEVNPTTPFADGAALAGALVARLGPSNVSSYTLVACGAESASALAGAQIGRSGQHAVPLRVLRGGQACSVRGMQLEEALGECDVFILGIYSPAEPFAGGTDGPYAPALRTSMLLELPSVLQHAVSPRSVVALHGASCPLGAARRGKYSAPWFVKNLTEPCWHDDSFGRLSGALVHAGCHELGGAGYRLCVGTLKPKRSVCASQPALLESARERGSRDGPGRRCVVRKDVVSMRAASRNWNKATHARSTLSHLYRRHLRYFSVHACDGRGGEADRSAGGRGGQERGSQERGSQVCLMFKDDVLEEWVAGLNSSDGLSFHGDPVLVMPRLGLRAQTLMLPHEAQAMGRGGGRRARKQAKADAKRLESASHAVMKTVASTSHTVAGWSVGGAGGVRVATRYANDWLHNGSATAVVARLSASMTHNFALARTASGEWLAVGGRHNRISEHLWPNSPLLRPPVVTPLRQRLGRPPELVEVPRIGLWMVKGSTWQYDNTPPAPPPPMRATKSHTIGDGMTAAARAAKAATTTSQSTSWFHAGGGVDEPATTQWRDKRLILDGKHPGCVEGRDANTKDFQYLFPGVCEYDGRVRASKLYTRPPPTPSAPDSLSQARTHARTHCLAH